MGIERAELIMELEEVFDIRIKNKDAEYVFTVEDLYACVQKYSKEPLEEITSKVNAVLTEKSGIKTITPELDINKDLGLN